MVVLRNCFGGRPIRTYSPTGEGYKTRFSKVVDDDTKFSRLIPIEKVDVYAEIQSFLGQTDVSLMCRRAINGELSIFNASHGSYMDITKLPDDYNSVFKNFTEVEKYFNMIPDEVKADCTNLKSFLKSITTLDGIERFNKRYNDYIKSKSAVNIPKEVNENG